MHPGQLSILDYTYDLPAERIACYPLPERDSSKLLIYRKSDISETIYTHLDDHLPANTLIVFNNTRVVEARLLFTKASGSTIEVFCLEPHEQYADVTTAMLQKGKVLWKCLVGGAKKWKPGELLTHSFNGPDAMITLTATKLEHRSDHYIVELSWSDTTLSFAELLHFAGSIPLPPYLNRGAEEKDKETYQTIYAKHDGSVAAPTAGLHFTTQLLDKLSAKQIEAAYVTLHVGAGTFKPVKAATMQEHDMHAEFIDVNLATIQQLIDRIDGTIVAAGTTSLRTIETLYWMGVKLGEQLRLKAPGTVTIKTISIHQWDAYELPQDVPAAIALQNLVNWMQQYTIERLVTKTQIIIAPGYSLRVAKGLLTNFHQPQSTLLLLVAAITGNDWRRIYDYALDNQFRFLSYGDGSLLWKD